MKTSFKAFTYGLSTLMAVGLVFISSCSKDKDDPEPQVSSISFNVTELTINEADGEIEIEIVLDKPAAEDFTLEYELGGTAREKEDNPDPQTGAYDYEIVENLGEVEFEKGDESATIVLAVYSDPAVEGYVQANNACTPETIIISLDDVDSDLIDIGNDDEIEIQVEQEDGTIIALFWGPTDEEADPYTDVDMDLILWAEVEGELVATDFLQPTGSFISPELRFIPKVILEDGPYGFSYNYYEGSVEPMEWGVTFADLTDGSIEDTDDQESFEGIPYSLANRNKWDEEEGTDLILAQTFDIDEGQFKNFSIIDIEETGSRRRTGIPSGLTRSKSTSEFAINPKYLRAK
jgi:hypothetical protein